MRTPEEVEAHRKEWEEYKMWDILTTHPEIETEDYSRARKVIDGIFKKWRDESTK